MHKLEGIVLGLAVVSIEKPMVCGGLGTRPVFPIVTFNPAVLLKLLWDDFYNSPLEVSEPPCRPTTRRRLKETCCPSSRQRRLRRSGRGFGPSSSFLGLFCVPSSVSASLVAALHYYRIFLRIQNIVLKQVSFFRGRTGTCGRRSGRI